MDHYGSYAKNVHLSNMIIEGVTDSAINVEKAWQGYVISNNTIVNCGKGITVHGVGVSVDGSVLTAEATKIGTKRVYHASAVESNLVVDCTDYAIKIGSSSGSAAAWDPFAEAFGEGSGNPAIPVRNNMVHDCGSSPMQGDIWYDVASGLPGTGDYGPMANGGRSLVIGGQLVEEFEMDPLFVDEFNGDYRLGVGSPALGAGSPYRIDVLPGTETSPSPKIMRRSIGALQSDDPNDYQVLQ